MKNPLTGPNLTITLVIIFTILWLYWGYIYLKP